MKRIGFLMTCGVLTVAFGCDNRTVETDGGGIVLMDSGPDEDAGTDSGPGDTCPPAMEDPPAGNACAQTTLDCIMAATSQAMLQACIDADPNPQACVGCLNQEVISCGSRNGCDEEWGEVICCLTEACPSADAACINSALGTGGACGTDLNTFLSCVNGLPTGTCGITPLCFPPAP